MFVLDADGIRVNVQEPKSHTVTEGQTITFTCVGISQVRHNVCTTLYVFLVPVLRPEATQQQL